MNLGRSHREVMDESLENDFQLQIEIHPATSPGIIVYL